MVPMEVSIRTDIGEMRVLVSWAAEDQREWMLLELQGSLSAESRPDLKGLVLGRVERVGEADSDEVSGKG